MSGVFEVGLQEHDGGIALARVENVKDDHLVTLVTEMLQPGNDLVGVVEQVRHDNHQPAPFDPLGHFVQSDGDIGLLGRFLMGDLAEQDMQMTGFGAGRNVAADFLIKRHQPDGVALTEHHV